MAKPTEAQREAFETLRRTYLEQVPDRIEAIRRAVARVGGGGREKDALHALHHLTHRLVGSSAIYGLPTVSVAARALEEKVAALLAEGERPRSGRFEQLVSLVEDLERSWSEASPRTPAI